MWDAVLNPQTTSSDINDSDRTLSTRVHLPPGGPMFLWRKRGGRDQPGSSSTVVSCRAELTPLYENRCSVLVGRVSSM